MPGLKGLSLDFSPDSTLDRFNLQVKRWACVWFREDGVFTHCKGRLDWSLVGWGDAYRGLQTVISEVTKGVNFKIFSPLGAHFSSWYAYQKRSLH